MTRYLGWIPLSVLLLITISRAPAALRHHRQRQLWLAYVFLTVGFAFVSRGLGRLVQDLPGLPYADQPIRHLAAVGASATLLGFMTTISDLQPAKRKRIEKSFYLSGAAVAAAMTILFAVASPLHADADRQILPTPGTWTTLTAYWLTFLTYGVTALTLGASGFGRRALKPNPWPLRASIASLALGCACGVAYCLLRAVLLVAPGHRVVLSVHYSLATGVLFLGLGSVRAAGQALRKGIRQYRALRQLYPLWRAVAGAADHVVLDGRIPGRTRDGLSMANQQARLYRRVIEIRDGMLDLRDYLTADHAEAIRAGVASLSLPADQTEAAVTACWIMVTSQRKASGAVRAATPYVDLIADRSVHTADLAAEAQALHAVAIAGRNRGVQQVAAAHAIPARLLSTEEV